MRFTRIVFFAGADSTAANSTVRSARTKAVTFICDLQGTLRGPAPRFSFRMNLYKSADGMQQPDKGFGLLK